MDDEPPDLETYVLSEPLSILGLSGSLGSLSLKRFNGKAYKFDRENRNMKTNRNDQKESPINLVLNGRFERYHDLVVRTKSGKKLNSEERRFMEECYNLIFLAYPVDRKGQSRMPSNYSAIERDKHDALVRTYESIFKRED